MSRPGKSDSGRRHDGATALAAGDNDNRAADPPVLAADVEIQIEPARETAAPTRRPRPWHAPSEPPPSLPAPAPYVPRHPFIALCYAATSVMIAVTYGLGLNFVNANLSQVSGEFSATTNEALWLTAAYMAPNVSLSLLLVKIRAQYGLRHFAELAIVVFIVVNGLHLFTHDLGTAVIARFFAGIAAAPMSTLSFLYILECFPPERKMTIGMPLAMVNVGLGAPIARLISPALLDLGGWQPIYLMEVGLALISLALIYALPLNSPPKVKVLGFMDVVSYLFLAVGFGTLAVVLSMGRYYWWLEAPWLGWLLVVSIVSLVIVAVIELNRKYPLLDIKWLLSPEVAHFAGVLMLFRMILADGEVSESEMQEFRRICRESFGIPDESIEGVIEYLNDFGYETGSSQAIAMFRDLDIERRRLLARHMAEIAKADHHLAENEVRLLRRSLDILGISPVDVVKGED